MSIFKSLLIAILIITNLNSCTKIIWEKTFYEDNFKKIMTTRDGKKIVIIGKKFHYVFDDKTGNIFKLLSWENRSKLKIEKYNIRVSQINKITASITIKTNIEKDQDYNFNDEEKDFLRELGFININSDNNFFEKNINIEGTRYFPKSGINYEANNSSTKEHKIKIEVDSYLNKAKKIALTPVAIVADGVLVTLYVGGKIILENPSILCSKCRSK